MTTDDQIKQAAETFLAVYARNQHVDTTLEFPAVMIAIKAAIEPVVTAALGAALGQS